MWVPSISFVLFWELALQLSYNELSIVRLFSCLISFVYFMFLFSLNVCIDKLVLCVTNVFVQLVICNLSKFSVYFYKYTYVFLWFIYFILFHCNNKHL